MCLELFWQLQQVGNFHCSHPMVCMTHGLIVHPLVQVTLQNKELTNIARSPRRPIMRSEQNAGLCCKHFDALVDVLRPVQCITHKCSANRNQVVHGLRTILCHTQPTMVWKEEIHFSRCFGLGCELENHSHTIKHKFLASKCDVGRRREQTRRTHWHTCA